MRSKNSFFKNTTALVFSAFFLVSCTPEATETFTVTWQDSDGTTLEVDEDVLADTLPTYDGDNPTKNGDAQYTYTFSGWSPEVTNVAEDITYVAQYTSTINTYTVTWKNSDETVLEIDDDVPYGATPTYDGAAPTKELYGSHTYSFSGWSPVVEPANGETIYVAQYTANAKNPHEYLYYSEGENSVTITGFIYSGYVSLILPELINDKPVTSIGDMAFYNCTSLKYVDIPDSVTYIGNNAFSFCTRLETVELSQNVATIGSQAFSTCLSLASIDIPDSVNSLGIQAFGDCSNLSSAKLPNNLPAINIGTFLRCQKLETIEIPNSVTTIANNAFSDCLKLESIDIPSSVEYIGTEAFVRCTELKEVYIPISVTYIGDYAFKNINSTPQVYCEAVSKPEGWSADWIIDSSCVIWDYLNN